MEAMAQPPGAVEDRILLLHSFYVHGHMYAIDVAVKFLAHVHAIGTRLLFPSLWPGYEARKIRTNYLTQRSPM